MITDDQAKALIDLGSNVGFYIHTGTQLEQALVGQLDNIQRVVSGYELYELPLEKILTPKRTLFAFVRYPRLLLYSKKSVEQDLIGFSEIAQWIKGQHD